MTVIIKYVGKFDVASGAIQFVAAPTPPGQGPLEITSAKSND